MMPRPIILFLISIISFVNHANEQQVVGAIAWMQDAAEYQAASIQTFKTASFQLEPA
jgi:predicted secreted acid phosphatase